MKRKILPLIMVGILVLSGIGVVAVTSGVTLSSQKQLESRESENMEKLQFWWIWVYVKEIYGTVDDPQFRPLANVTVEVKASLVGIFWSPFWSGKTDKRGRAEVDIIDSLCYKVMVSKDGYHTYKCLPFKIIISGDQFLYYANFTMAEDGSPFVQQISKSSQQQSTDSQQSSSILSSQSVIFDDNTPPVSTHILDPPYPNGLNGWYVSDVTVSLNATDDMSGVKEIRYRIDYSDWQIIPGDHGAFLLTDDGDDILVEYYAIDNAGNEEAHHLFSIDMDQTKPEMDLRWDAHLEDGKWYIQFTVYCVDAMSGMNRVEFYFNDVLQETVYGPGPIYGWGMLYYVLCKVKGLIREPKITEEYIRVYAIVVLIGVFHSYWEAVAYDNAGNTDSDYYVHEMHPDDFPYLGLHIFKYLILPNDYTGYIGEYLIDATFNVINKGIIVSSLFSLPENLADPLLIISQMGMPSNSQQSSTSYSCQTMVNVGR